MVLKSFSSCIKKKETRAKKDIFAGCGSIYISNITIPSEHVTSLYMVRVGGREFDISGYIEAGDLRPRGRSGSAGGGDLYKLLVPNDGGAKALQRIVPVC